MQAPVLVQARRAEAQVVAVAVQAVGQAEAQVVAEAVRVVVAVQADQVVAQVVAPAEAGQPQQGTK